ncbi:MAG TPA: hypothetical protein VKS60_21980 [Stellaceae bacterium]|nr:hypothetical protein [Stellaceae bacterium]
MTAPAIGDTVRHEGTDYIVRGVRQVLVDGRVETDVLVDGDVAVLWRAQLPTIGKPIAFRGTHPLVVKQRAAGPGRHLVTLQGEVWLSTGGAVHQVQEQAHD